MVLVIVAGPHDLGSLSEAWPAVPVEIHRRRLGEQEGGRATYLVATLDGAAVGAGVVRWTGCVGHEARQAFPEAVETTDLQVVATMRGREVGTALLRAAEDHARRRGLTLLAVSVDVDHGARARRLYRRLGYEPTGVSDTCTYRGVADDGMERIFTETSELLVASLTGSRRSAGQPAPAR